MLRTTDNNCGKEIEKDYLSDLNLIANRKISDLIFEDNPNLLVFPNDLNCKIRSKADTHSVLKRTVIPGQNGHPFRFKADTRSG
jgi:hypothetical protein